MSLLDQAIELDLLSYGDKLKLKKEGDKTSVWDPIRKKFVVLQPEEFVRQTTLQFLLANGFSERLIAVEKEIKIGDQKKRYDILVYQSAKSPLILIECKKPEINLTQRTFDQISLYNIGLKIPYLLITNGRRSFLCKIDFIKKKYTFIKQLPRINKNTMSDLQWNYTEFLTFVLIHAAFADLEFTQDEIDLIQGKCGKETYERILKQYDEMGDYERLQEIIKYKGVYFPTADRKMEILDEMKKLFDADGIYSKLEVSLMNFLEHML